MRNKRNDKSIPSGIAVTLPELIQLRAYASADAMRNGNKWLKIPGQRLTTVRGRGIEFDATREYQAGDDIRNMAWRVTARSLKPHIKVYREEKERPVWLAIDLSPSLYFGTRTRFKSVSSIRRAVLLGWTYLAKRERIGALIANAATTQIFQPKTSEQHYLTILNQLAVSSQQQPAFTEHNYLQNLLLSTQQFVRSGNLVAIFSDFFHFNAHTQKMLIQIAQHTQVVLFFIYDPFEAEAPPPYPYILTNGQKPVAFAMDDAQCRREYQQQFQTKQQELIRFTRKYNIVLHIMRTDQEE